MTTKTAIGDQGMSNYINIISQYGYVETTCDQSPTQMTYKTLVDKLISDNYTQLNEWHQKDARFK